MPPGSPRTIPGWLSTGKTIGGTPLFADDNILSREQALQLWTEGSAWFSGEAGLKGKLEAGMYADMAVLSEDYFMIADEAIKGLHSVLTMTGGNVVHASAEFSDLDPPLPPVSPDWSPVRHAGTPGSRQHVHGKSGRKSGDAHHAHAGACHLHNQERPFAWRIPVAASDLRDFWGALGCSCFAF